MRKGEKRVKKKKLSNSFSNLMETVSPKFQEAEQTPSTRKIKRTTAEHIITEQIKSMIKKT